MIVIFLCGVRLLKEICFEMKPHQWKALSLSGSIVIDLKALIANSH